MSDKHQFNLLAQLCAELERHHDDFTLKNAAYDDTLNSGFALLAYLVDNVCASLPEYAEASEVVTECRQYLEYYLNPPQGALVEDE